MIIINWMNPSISVRNWLELLWLSATFLCRVVKDVMVCFAVLLGFFEAIWQGNIWNNWGSQVLSVGERRPSLCKGLYLFPNMIDDYFALNLVFNLQVFTCCFLCSNFRGFLIRKRQMEQNLGGYTPSSRDLEWARKYKQDLKKREDMRKQKNQYTFLMWVSMYGKVMVWVLPLTFFF